jgi:hypothetical protein
MEIRGERSQSVGGVRDHEPFTFSKRVGAFKKFLSDGLEQLSVGEDPVRHDDVGAGMDFIDDNVFDIFWFHRKV